MLDKTAPQNHNVRTDQQHDIGDRNAYQLRRLSKNVFDDRIARFHSA